MSTTNTKFTLLFTTTDMRDIRPAGLVSADGADSLVRYFHRRMIQGDNFANACEGGFTVNFTWIGSTSAVAYWQYPEGTLAAVTLLLARLDGVEDCLAIIGAQKCRQFGNLPTSLWEALISRMDPTASTIFTPAIGDRDAARLADWAELLCCAFFQQF